MKYHFKKNMDKKQKTQKYERIGILEIEEVLPYIIESINQSQGSARAQIKSFQVKVSSLRLKTFAKTGTACTCCGDKASFFAVERNNPTGPYHLNLWGYNKNQEPILFTHDHILARSLGGKDNLSNTETMCSPCNFEKSLIEHKISQFPERKEEFLEEIERWKESKKPQKIKSKTFKF